MLKEAFKNELPHRKNANNGHSASIIAYMRGAHKIHDSKIFSILNNDARYPFNTWREGVELVVNRLVNKRQLTWVQVYLLDEYVVRKYSGNTNREWAFGLIGFPEMYDKQHNDLRGAWHGVKDFSTSMILHLALNKLNKDLNQIPLRLLISHKFTDFILSIQLESAIFSKTCIDAQLKQRSKPWKLTN